MTFLVINYAEEKLELKNLINFAYNKVFRSKNAEDLNRKCNMTSFMTQLSRFRRTRERFRHYSIYETQF